LHNLSLKDFYDSSWNFEQGNEEEEDDLKEISNHMGNQTILLSRQKENISIEPCFISMEIYDV
jgi:hypothetical protein